MTTPPTSSQSTPSLAAAAVSSFLRLGSPRRSGSGSSPRTPRVVSSASSPAVSTQTTPRSDKPSKEEEMLRQRDLLYAFFAISHSHDELQMLKGHLRNVTTSPEYNNQILKIFNKSIYNDELEYEQRKEEFLQTPTERSAGKLEEYFNTTFRSAVKAKYKIELPPLVIPEKGDNGYINFKFPEACIKTAILTQLRKDYFPTPIDGDALFNTLTDYDIWQHCDNETENSGGDRSYLSSFCAILNQIFLDTIRSTFMAKGDELQERLKQKREFVELYLTYQLGECNGILIALRSYARRIICRLEQRVDSVTAKCTSKRRPSSVKLELSPFKLDEDLSPRTQSGSKIHLKTHEEPETEVLTPRGQDVRDGEFFYFSRYDLALQIPSEMISRLPPKINEDFFEFACIFAGSYTTTEDKLKKTMQEILGLFAMLHPLDVPEKVSPEVRKHLDSLSLIMHYANMQTKCIREQLTFLK